MSHAGTSSHKRVLPMLTAKRSSAAILVILVVASGVSAQPADDSLRGALLRLAVVPNVRPLVADQVDGLARLIGLEISTSPTGASAGGLRFTFDSSSGTFARSSRSFGPAFAERSLTSGKGRVSVGVNWLYADFNSFAGMDLNDGVQATRAVQALPGATGTSKMNLSSSSVQTFATYGISNNVDIGILVPWIRVSMSASSVLSDANTVFLAASVPQTVASGVGDVGLLGKYRFWNGDAGTLAAQIQVSLPSGDEDDLRGLGITRTLLSAIWSREGRF